MMAEVEVSEPLAGETKADEPTLTDPSSSSEPEVASDPPQPSPTAEDAAAAASATPPVPAASENAAAGSTAEPPVDLNGTWKLARNEHFDEYLKAAGVGFLTRKMINSFSPTIEIKQKGEEFTFSSKTPRGERVTSFKVGVEYPETNPMFGNDKEHRLMPEWQGAKLVQRVVHGSDDGKPRSFEREIVSGELVTTIRRGDNSCKRIFKNIRK